MAEGSIFGSDVSRFHDGIANLDPLATLIEGERVVLEDIACRLQTPRGFYRRWPDYGYDLTAQVGRRVSTVGLVRLKAAIATECIKDERVRSATVSAIEAVSAGVWHVSIQLILATGPFTLVLSVDKVTVAILRAAKGS